MLCEGLGEAKCSTWQRTECCQTATPHIAFNSKRMTISNGVMIIVAATLASFILANAIDMSGYELGALINMFWPPILGVACILVYIVTAWITKNNRARK